MNPENNQPGNETLTPTPAPTSGPVPENLNAATPINPAAPTVTPTVPIEPTAVPVNPTVPTEPVGGVAPVTPSVETLGVTPSVESNVPINNMGTPPSIPPVNQTPIEGDFKEEKPRKNPRQLIALIVLVLGLAFIGYYVYENFVKNDEPTVNNNNNEENPVNGPEGNKIDPDQDFVFIKESETLRDETISRLPQINLDNPRATAFNANLETRFKSALANAEWDDELDGYTNVTRFGFRDYLNGDILSFVLIENSTFDFSGGSINYEILNFNIRTNQELTQNDILEYKEITLDEFKEMVNAAIEEYFDEIRTIYNVGGQFMETGFQGDVQNTKDSIDYDALLIFLNQNGNLSIIIDIFNSFGHDDRFPFIMEIV